MTISQRQGDKDRVRWEKYSRYVNETLNISDVMCILHGTLEVENSLGEKFNLTYIAIISVRKTTSIKKAIK